MPPSNTAFATATDLGVLPADITQTDINDGGVNYTVYYKFTAPLNAKVIGAWAFSGNIGAGYRPTIEPYNSSEVRILNIAAVNMPIQFPVTEGQLYYLKVIKNTDTAGPEDVRIRVEVAPNNVILKDDIIVNDDTKGFPLAALVGNTSHTVRRFINGIVAGEGGDVLKATGISLLTDSIDTGNVVIYNSDFSIRATVTTAMMGFTTSGATRVRAHNPTEKFYLGPFVASTRIIDISKEGVVGSSIILPNSGYGGHALSNDGTILYVVNPAGSVTNAPVKQWSIAGGAFIADLVAGIANYATKDIIVLEDDSILVAYNKTSGAPWDVIVKRYNAAGATLNTYTINGSVISCILGMATDSPNSFWVWTHDVSSFGISTFTNIKVSDGSVLATRDYAEYEGGAYQAAESASPLARFGNSFSCPFFVMPAASPAGILIIVPDKRTDNDGLNTVAIPNPTFKTALVP